MAETAIVTSPLGDGASFELAQRQAKAIAASSLVPDTYKSNVPNTLIAMEVANRIGASVLAVMQHLYIVHNRPAFDATFLIGCVASSGKYSPLRYQWEGTPGKDDWGCRAIATDLRSGEVCPGPMVTFGMARKEGWVDKKGSKWQTMPELMLHYRAASWWVRVYAPELSLGMQTVEEIRDVVPQAATTVTLDSVVEQMKQPPVEDVCKDILLDAAKSMRDEIGKV